MPFHKEYIPKYDNSEQHGLDLGSIIKSALSKQSLSLRKLSELCGISPSSISRILSNKQSASIKHLQLFSAQLQIPLTTLFKAAGIEIEEHANESSKVILETLKYILKPYDIELDGLVPEIKRDLRKYEQYAKAASGEQSIKNNFLPKLQLINAEGAIIDQLIKLYQLYCLEGTDPQIRSVAGSALLYLLSMPDAIPDYIFPVGYLDDTIAVILTVKRLASDFNIYL